MKYKTVSLRVMGAICGRMWMPEVLGTLQHSFDVERTLARFSDASEATMRDVLLHELMEHGGDFQSSKFTADTHIVIKRKASAGMSHTRYVSLGRWIDCADLVNAEIYSNDFDGCNDE